MGQIIQLTGGKSKIKKRGHTICMNWKRFLQGNLEL
jgi:hypothetical protein